MKICTNNVPRETVCYWDILTEYSERFSEYPWLEDETLVMDKGIDEFILGKLKEGEKAIKENCELITYRGSECA